MPFLCYQLTPSRDTIISKTAKFGPIFSFFCYQFATKWEKLSNKLSHNITRKSMWRNILRKIVTSRENAKKRGVHFS